MTTPPTPAAPLPPPRATAILPVTPRLKPTLRASILPANIPPPLHRRASILPATLPASPPANTTPLSVPTVLPPRGRGVSPLHSRPQPQCAPHRASNFLLAALLLLSLALTPLPSRAAPPPSPPTRVDIESAVERALTHLAQSQRRDGSIGEGNLPLLPTSLAVQAYLSAGRPPGDGRFGLVISKAEDYLLAHLPPPNSPDAANIQLQSSLALTFAQLLGTEPSEPRRAKLRAALTTIIPLLLKSQLTDANTPPTIPPNTPPNISGGWPETTSSPHPLLAPTAAAIQALKAAQSAGQYIPPEVFTSAATFTLQLRTPPGGFADPDTKSDPEKSTAAGTLILALTSPPESLPPEAASALELLAHATTTPNLQAIQSATVLKGTTAEKLIQSQITTLLPTQLPDGSFPGDTTATTVLLLTTPWSVLPPPRREPLPP